MKSINNFFKNLCLVFLFSFFPSTLFGLSAALSVSDATIVEGDDPLNPTYMSFVVKSTTADTTGGIRFDYTTTIGSATASDFTSVSGQGTIPINQKQVTIQVPIKGDLDFETPDDETFTFTITKVDVDIEPGKGTATGTIYDNDTRNLTINSPSAITEGSDAVFTVTLNGDKASVDLPFTFTTTGSGVTLGDDYTVGSYSGKILANQTTATITIPTVDDSDVEGSETLKVNLVSTNPPLGTPNSGTITINDNDLYGITIAADANNSVAEGNTSSRNATYKVTINQPHTANVDVHWALSGGVTNPADGTDFVSGLISGDLNFTSGQTEKTITIPIKGDTTAEQNEKYTVTLSSPSANATLLVSSVDGTINNDDSGTVSISQNSSTVDEGNSVTYTVKLSFVPTSAVSVNYSVTNKGTTSASDHNGGTNGSVNFAIGDDTETFTITATNDTDEEPAESFDVNLTSATGATITSPSGVNTTINASDGRTLSISPLTGTATTEGNTTNPTVSYTVKLSGKPLNNVKVNYALTNTTTDDTDFLFTTYPKSGSLIFTPSDYADKTITFQIHGDTDAEPNQTYKVTITSADANATVESGKGEATGTITNDDSPVLYFDPKDYNVTETNGNQNLTLTVKLTGSISTDVKFKIKTIDGTAKSTAPLDFTAQTGTDITINAGTTSKTFTVQIKGDSTPESTESFSVGIYNLSTGNATISPTDGNATITIYDNDLAQVQIATLPKSSIVEGNSGITYAEFNVTIDKTPSSNVDVNYSVTGTSPLNATDFSGGVLPTNITVQFLSGTTTLYKTIQIPIQGDTTLEGNENFTVTLNSVSGATLGTTKTATGTILNDDTNVSAISDATVAEPPCPTDTTYADLTVTLAQAVTYPVTIYYQTEDGTAKAGSDYNSANSSITINGGETTGHIYITIRGDTNNSEGSENFKVNLTSAVDNLGNAIAITDANATVTITDNLDYNVTGFTGGSVTEGDTNGTQSIAFTVDYCKPLTSAKTLSIAYSSTAGSAYATQNVDYNASLASITIPSHPTNTSYTFYIPVYGDLITELDENFTLTLSGTNFNLTDSTATGTIYDDDNRQIDINSTSVIEGDTGSTTAQLRIHMSKTANAPVRVYYSTKNGSATTTDSDYTAKTGSTYYVDFAVGETDKYVDFSVTPDYNVEGNETFDVNISTPNGVTITSPGYGRITIQDDDNRTLTLGGTDTYTEGHTDQTVNLTVNFPGSPVDRTIYYYTTAGGASSPSDYTNVPSTTAIVIPASAIPLIVNLPITIKGDTLYELDENFTVTITSPDGFNIVNSPMQIKIIDDDGNLSINNPPAILEGDVGDKNITFTVTLSRDMNTTVNVNIGYTDDGATNPDDYTPVVTSLTFDPHQQTKTFDVPIHGDTAYEALAQRFKATITSPGMSITNNGSGVGVGVATITDDDARGVTISSASYLETETNQTRTFSIDLNQSLENDLVLTYTTVDGAGTNKAVAGSDYNGTSGTLTIGHGDTHASVDVKVYGDFVSEANEDFNLSVSTVTPGINFTGGKMTITNDDGNLSIVAAVDRNETNSSSFLMPFRVTVTPHPNTGSPIYVNYQTIDGTADSNISNPNRDFEAKSGTLTFAPGVTTQDINITVYGDIVYEGLEYFDINITNSQGVIITTASSRGNIHDDDGRVISITGNSANEGDQGVLSSFVTLNLSQISGSDANVTYTLSSTTATAGVDYNATGGYKMIYAGDSNVTIPIYFYGDLTFEQDDNITVTIATTSPGFNIPSNTANLKLINDDGILSIGNVTILEGNTSTTTSGLIRVTLSHHTSTLPIDINYTMIPGSATADVDYISESGKVTIPAGSDHVDINVTVLGDAETESSDETFTVRITNDQNVTISDADGTVTIDEDDIDAMEIFDHQRPFGLRFGKNIYGNYAATGAPIMCALDDTNTSCDWNRTGSLGTSVTRFLNDASMSKNSSSADLNITMEPGDKVLWAGLYWQGHVESNVAEHLDNNTSGWNTIKFKTPLETKTITANLADANKSNYYAFQAASTADYDGFRFFYQGYADVTAEVNASLTTNTGRTFSVGDMTATTGQDHYITDPALFDSSDGSYGAGAVGHFGGWSLIVVYEKADKSNPDDLRNVSIFDGYQYLVSGTANPNKYIDISISGFRTPSSLAAGEDIDSTLLYFGGGSEKTITGDEMRIADKAGNKRKVSDGKNPSNNPFNDTISRLGEDVNSTRIFNPGIDLDTIQVSQCLNDSSVSESCLDTNQSSTIIRLSTKFASSQSDQAFVGAIGFSTQLYQPQLCYDFSYQQNGAYMKNNVGERDIPTLQGRVIQGDEITAGIYLKNTDSDFAIRGLSLFSDMNGSKISYIPNTTKVSRVNGVTYPPSPADEEDGGACSYAGSASDQACRFPTTDDVSKDDIRVGVGSGTSGYTKTTAGELGSGDFVYTQFKLDPHGLSGDVNESLGLKIDYYIDLDNGDGQIQVQYTLGTHLKLCPASSVYLPTWGRFNVVDRNTTNNLGSYYNLYTQTAKKPFNVDVAYYESNGGLYNQPGEVNTTVMAEIIDVDAYHDINASCANPGAAITPAVFVQMQTTASDNTQPIPLQIPNDYNYAVKNAAYRVWWFDTGDINHSVLAQNWTATTSNETYRKVDNVTGISGLFNSSKHADCNASCFGSETTTGCFTCMKDRYTHPICSRDNFSIRPEALDVRIRDYNATAAYNIPISLNEGYTPKTTPTGRIDLASGYTYFYDLNATNNTDLEGTPGYTRYFSGNGSDYSALMEWNSTKVGCNDTAGKTLAFDVKNGSMVDSNSSFDQIGEYKVHVSDTTWTAVDWRDTSHHTTGFLPGSDCTANSTTVPVDTTTTKIGCNISSTHAHTTAGINYIDPQITFHPYSFDLSNITFTRGTSSAPIVVGGRNFIYMADINVSSDANMSLKASGLIAADNYKGSQVSNFVTGCYAKNINVTIVRSDDYNQSLASYQARFVDTTTGYDSNVSAISSGVSPSFGLGEGNFTVARAGDTNTTMSLNYDRSATTVVNPIRTTFTNYAVACSNSSDCQFAAEGINKQTEGNLSMGFGVTHYYGRAEGMDSRVKTKDENTTTARGNIRVNFEIFCGNDTNTSCTPAQMALLPDGVNTPRGEDKGWFKNRDHNVSNDGLADANNIITRKSGDGNVTITSAVQTGIDGINITASEIGFEHFGVTYTGNKGYPHTVIMQNDPSHWLIYDPKNANATFNNFTIEFYKPSAWVGQDKAKTSTDSDASLNPSRRIMW